MCFLVPPHGGVGRLFRDFLSLPVEHRARVSSENETKWTTWEPGEEMVASWAVLSQLVTSSAEFETLWKLVVSALTKAMFF
jgi:hypothetical protein